MDIFAGIENFKNQYKEAEKDIDKATSFWNRANPQTRELLINGQYQILRDRMFSLLRTCKQIDNNVYESIHKGHPYFFIGITSYHLGDYQTAISFFDAALSEDLSIEDGIERPTQLFFLLKVDNTYNAALQETKFVESKINRAITFYNDVISQNNIIPRLTIQDICDNFIKFILNSKNDPGLRSLLTTLFTFVVEWDYRNEHLDLGVTKGTSEALFMHLLRGCVMFESLLNRNPNPKSKHKDQNENLYQLLTYYQQELKLTFPYNTSSNKTDIDKLGILLDELSEQKEELDQLIMLAYRLRNILGHNLAWEDRIDQTSYQKLYFIVISACLHVINCLWKP